MAQELGDEPIGFGVTRTRPSDGTNLSAGDAVTVNGSNQVTPTSDGSDLYGVVIGPADTSIDLSSLSAGDDVVVKTFGDVIANVGSSVTEGDLVETTSTSGRLGQNSTGTEVDVDEGGTDTYTIAMNTAKALSDANGTAPSGESLGSNEAAIFLY